MESRSVLHSVGYYVSLDAPHQGAVLDHGLQNWIAASDPNLIPIPANLVSYAGKQLLEFNPQDLSRPTLHEQFSALYAQTNVDGYPHATTENIGVSFGTAALNSSVGQEWLEIAINLHPNAHFDIESGSVEAQGGSLLSESTTDMWGKAFWGLATYEFFRKAHPTFIPYTSALDIVNGASRFAPPVISADLPRFHNQFTGEIAEPLLARLGYVPIPLTASISGPTLVASGGSGVWSVPASQPYGGTPPYVWHWSYKLTCLAPPPPSCTGMICAESSGGIVVSPTTNGPTDPDPCGVWTYGGWSRWFTRSGSYSYPSMTVRLIVNDAASTSVQYTKTVTFGAGARAAGGDSTGTADGGFIHDAAKSSATTSEASNAFGVPGAYALRAVAPNPTQGRTTIRFDLPNASDVSLSVLDVLGREVARLADGRMGAGTYESALDATSLPPGLYIVRLQAGSFAASRTFTLTR